MNPRQPNYWKTTQLIYDSVLDRLDTHFCKLGINYMPIKGAFLILSGLSTKISSRKMRDIDILVSREDFGRVIQYFDSLPNTKKATAYWEFEQPFIYQDLSHSVYLEIHHLINAPARFLLPAEDLFSRGIQFKKHCFLPDPVDSMLIHVCHHLLHIYDNFEISFFNEIAILEKQNDFDWSEFWRRAQKTGIKPFIWFLITMYSKITGNKIDIPAWGTLYSKTISKLDFNWLSALKPFQRKFLLEIPFVRNPLWLFKHKAARLIRQISKRP